MSRLTASLFRVALATLTAFGVLALGSGAANAADGSAQPVNLALLSPIQLVPEDQSVKGFRLSLLYGRNQDVEGIDLSLIGVNDGNGSGIQFGAINYAETVEGIQLSFLNLADQLHGIQIGILNFAKNGFMPVFPIFNFNFDD